MSMASPAHSGNRRCRLCLVTPAAAGVTSTSTLEIGSLVAAALSGGDVAAIIVTGDPGHPDDLPALAGRVVPIAAEHGVATLLHNDTRVAGRVRADGVHLDGRPETVAAAVAAVRGNHRHETSRGSGVVSGPGIVGAGGIRSRHDAMLLAEADPDYLFFGLLDGDRDPWIFRRALELAAWWAEVAVIPAMVMGGRSIASVDQAADAGVEFVALRHAVWDDSRGPAAAVADANLRLAALVDAVA
jgi:thiamine-phosphate pyrophosphorylase